VGDAPAFLLVEDDEAVMRMCRRLLLPFGRVVEAKTIAEALCSLTIAPSWLAFVFDVRLMDGTGLNLLEIARRDHPHVPALICTGVEDMSFVNRAFDLRASLLKKPLVSERIVRFARAAVGEGDGYKPVQPLATAVMEERRLRVVIPQIVADYARLHGLSEKQVEIVETLMFVRTRADCMAHLEMNENTFKTQVSRLLEKTKERCLEHVRDAIVHELIWFDQRRAEKKPVSP
jgi:DNA-binding NarL/FixJ family response regulator